MKNGVTELSSARAVESLIPDFPRRMRRSLRGLNPRSTSFTLLFVLGLVPIQHAQQREAFTHEAIAQLDAEIFVIAPRDGDGEDQASIGVGGIRRPRAGKLGRAEAEVDAAVHTAALQDLVLPFGKV